VNKYRYVNSWWIMKFNILTNSIYWQILLEQCCWIESWLYWVFVSAVPTWISQWIWRPADGWQRRRHRSSPCSTDRVNSDVPTLGRDGRDEEKKRLRRQPPYSPYPDKDEAPSIDDQQSRRPATDHLQLLQHRKRSGKDEISVIWRLHMSTCPRSSPEQVAEECEQKGVDVDKLLVIVLVTRSHYCWKKIICQSTLHQMATSIQQMQGSAWTFKWRPNWRPNG